LAAAGGAQASCHSIGCLSGQIRALTNRVHHDEQVASANAGVFNHLVGCLKEVPATRYGDASGSFGYAFDPGGGRPGFDTSALDVTLSGGTVSAWVLYDGCNTTVTTAIRHAQSARPSGNPIAPEASLSQFPPQRITR
jgi:hypothetical protein